MMNLFSMFDSNIMKMPINTLTNMMIILIMLNTNIMWMKNYTMKSTMNKMNKFLLTNKNNKASMKLFMPLSMMIVMMNMMNLIPNMMSMSSTITMNFLLTTSLWMTAMMMMMKNNKIMMMNLSPKNTPMMMMWIINLIELNSMMFQILSLTMRLSINMMLGHIIMNLMKMIIPMMMYMMIELMIILIQSYIFVTLNMLNFSNMN